MPKNFQIELNFILIQNCTLNGSTLRMGYLINHTPCGLCCADLKIKVGVMSDHKSMASHCLLNKKSKQ